MTASAPTLVSALLDGISVPGYYDDQVDGEFQAIRTIDHGNGVKQVINSDTMSETWYKDGKVHRDGDKPAYTQTRLTGTDECWYQNGHMNRDGDKPASISYFKNGEVSSKVWYKNGLTHRDNDKPAYIRWYGGGSISAEVWYDHGHVSRDGDKPAMLSYSTDGVKTQIWYKDGVISRDGGKPALVRSDGRREWYENGKVIPRPSPRQ